MTIIPRGRALGLTMQLPTEDKYTYKKKYVEAQISILMGGRVAEELTQEDITTGAGNDIERATDMARRMVREWGMSELGPLAYSGKDEPVFLGRDIAQRADYSEHTAIRIDREVEKIVQEGYERARDILSTHRDVLESLAQDLLERESVDGQRVYDLIETMTGQNLTPAKPSCRAREWTSPPRARRRRSAASRRRPTSPRTARRRTARPDGTDDGEAAADDEAPPVPAAEEGEREVAAAQRRTAEAAGKGD